MTPSPAAARAPRGSLEAEVSLECTTETHVLRLRDFEKLPAVVGRSVNGPEFEVAGEKFRVSVYPGGGTENEVGFVGVYLNYRGTNDGVDTSYALNAAHSALPATRWRATDALFATHTDKERKWYRGLGSSKMFKRDGLCGELTITAEVTVRGEQTTTAVRRADSALQLLPLPPRSTNAGLLAMLNSGDLSDVVLKPSSGSGTIRCHKLVLAAGSPVLRAMFTRDMAEASSDEVTLEGLSATVLRRFVEFLYADELPDDTLHDTAEDLLGVAEFYQVARLHAVCERELCTHVDVETAARLMVLADTSHAPHLKEYCMNFIGQHPREVMQSDGWQLLGAQP
eukprot:COSAG02_NODE_17220_length_1020_cov_1.521173_1_plen_339_part_11